MLRRSDRRLLRERRDISSQIHPQVVTPLMLDGTYLSRNYATLGPMIRQPPCESLLRRHSSLSFLTFYLPNQKMAEIKKKCLFQFSKYFRCSIAIKTYSSQINWAISFFDELFPKVEKMSSKRQYVVPVIQRLYGKKE